MLSSLHIENIAVIKSADIDFKNGFTVLTGETGAGKSIIIDSLGLICGAKQSRELIRNGEDSAKVSAVFTDISERSSESLAELGITADEDGVLMFERAITAQGKSTSRLNGRVIPLSLQKEAMKSLIAIHGQHDNMALLTADNHMTYLDEFAGIEAELNEYRESYDLYCEITRKISDITKNEREKAQKLEFLRYQINEIETVKLKEGEEDKLLAKRKKLQNSEKITQLSDMIYSLLYRNEKSTAALDKVNKASRALEALAPVFDGADSLITRLDAVAGELEDIALTVDGLRDDDIGDPTAELDKVETRLEEISRLERKYGDTVEDVLKYLDSAKDELEAIELSEERLSELNAELNQVISVMDSKATVLTEKRKAAASKLEKMIVEELSYLDMGGVSFSCGVETKLPSGDNTASHYTKRGVDNVEFLISTNKGEPLKPLAKIASGGELSRIMLAIKSVLVKAEAPGTLIFDEVDTGVSGKTSQKIGIKLRELAKSSDTQVFCVTHAAQIAARGENHYLISKSESSGRVSTSVKPLDRDGRISEVARIMGGINITDTLMETAREMVDEVI